MASRPAGRGAQDGSEGACGRGATAGGSGREVAGAAAVRGEFVLEPALHVIDRGEAESGDVEGVERSHRGWAGECSAPRHSRGTGSYDAAVTVARQAQAGVWLVIQLVSAPQGGLPPTSVAAPRHPDAWLGPQFRS